MDPKLSRVSLILNEFVIIYNTYFEVALEQISFVALQFAILFLKNVQFFSLFAVLFYSEFVLVLKTVCFWNLL